MSEKEREREKRDDDDDTAVRTSTLASRCRPFSLSSRQREWLVKNTLHTHVNSISVPVAGSAEADATRTQGRAAGATFAAERRPAAAAARGAAMEQPRVAARADCIFEFVWLELVLEKEKGLWFASCFGFGARTRRERGRSLKGKRGNCGTGSAKGKKIKTSTLHCGTNSRLVRERSLARSRPQPDPKCGSSCSGGRSSSPCSIGP